MSMKWMNKRSQAINEKMNKNVDRTDFDADFHELAQQTDATKEAVEKILKQMPNFLHPNPTARAKMSVGSSFAKLRKTAAEKRYPHAVGDLSQLLLKLQDGFAPDSPFGTALRETGDVLSSINEASHTLDAEVSQNFMEPMKSLVDHDIKEVMKHRKKLEGRRLDFDYKRRKRTAGKTSVTDADIKIAEQKMEESRTNAENGMVNLLDNSIEQASQMMAFVQAYHTFFQTGSEMLAQLMESLEENMSEMASRPRQQRPVAQVNRYDDDDDDDYQEDSKNAPCAKAVFDFDAENEGELSFMEGDTIKLLGRLDENWLEGECKGVQGIFPSTYVEVIVDLE